MAAGPFAVPDEFISGLFKSTATLWQAMAGIQPQSGGAGQQAAAGESDGRGTGSNPSMPASGVMPAFPALPGLPAMPAISTSGLSAETLQKLTSLQTRYLQQQMAAWTSLYGQSDGTQGAAPGAIEPQPGDRRFRNPDWFSNPFLNLLKQSYLINSDYINAVVDAVDVDERTRHKLRFYAQQYVNAMSPANSPLTNPDVWKHLSQTQGADVMQGMQNLLEDMSKGKISITDETAFEVGKDVAVSKGSVVFENNVFQLIQYDPLTAKVGSRPLVIIPPCINKFYILDLQPANSFVRYANEQGNTVFVVSWQNAADRLHDVTWDDYVDDGALKAIAVAREITKADKANVVGWCVGGTITSTALAVMKARGDDHVASLTLLTTLLDFEESGDLGVFIDEDGVRQREETIGKGGIYPGQELAFVFQTLRPNDLIWPYVINNYMKGQSPDAFDLLYWNADSTNLAGPMYSWYLRNMYLENNLCKPGRLSVAGQKVDLSTIDMPTYILATQEDHIVPWESAYRSVALLGGKPEFVLGTSGHIAGVINPPSKNKRSYYSGGNTNGDAQDWLETAESTRGSWWTHWDAWLKPMKGRQVAAPKAPGDARHKPIEPAPGRYVQVRA